eukprot:7842571-Heterocapsa_arctica.AAC.1
MPEASPRAGRAAGGREPPWQRPPRALRRAWRQGPWSRPPPQRTQRQASQKQHLIGGMRSLRRSSPSTLAATFGFINCGGVTRHR